MNYWHRSTTLFNILILLVVFSSESIFAQNLISNPSFEVSTDSQKPEWQGEVELCQNWEVDMNIIHDNFFGLLGPICAWVHSPDYYNCTYGHFKLSDIEYLNYNPSTGQGFNSVLTDICGSDGNSYVGMSNGELIEQNLTSSLENGKVYTLSFYIRTSKKFIPSPLNSPDGEYSLSQFDIKTTKNFIQYLNFYIATKKIKYSDNIITCAQANNKSWTNFKDISTNHIEQIAYLGFNGSICPYKSWNKFTFDITIPDDNRNYEWFGFEVQRTDSFNDYLLLDDFALYKKGCEPDNCSQTSGDIQATANEYHTKSNPWFIDNIGNVSKATIEIRTIFSQELKRTIEVTATNGIKNRIYWDGKDANNTELATASYLIKVKLENECESTDANMIVWVDNQSAGSFTYPTYSYDNSGIKIPKECCVADIYIDNVTLSGPDQKRFVASHSVNVATLPSSWVTLTSNADVLFRAGSFVEVGPGFDQNDGTYNVEVVPCPGRYSNPEDEENSILTFNNDILENAKDEIKQDIKASAKEITLYPNPTKDKLFFTNLVDESYTVSIKNGVGKIVLNQSLNSNGNGIDCSQLANGIYLVLLCNEHINLHFKFVKN